MKEGKKTSELPLYKSREFHIEFKFTLENTSLLKKFEKDGEIAAETKVRINSERDFFGNPILRAIWQRPTKQGKENILLIKISPTDGFLEFLDKFAEKEKSIFSKYWIISYGSLVAVCNFCEKNQEEFKRAVRKAKDINELVMLSGFRD